MHIVHYQSTNLKAHTLLTRRLREAVPSVTTFPAWTFPNGINNEDANSTEADLKAIFVRGLAEARRRNPGTPLADYIEGYITVQVQQVQLINSHHLLTHL